MKSSLFRTFAVVAFAMAALIAGLGTGRPEAQTTMRGPHSQLPSWDQKLPAESRFVVLSDWGGAAVLDRETGLVWEKSPSGGTTHFSWTLALEHCSTLSVSDRLGWRLPTVQELTSLIDPSVTSTPALPTGHPFENVQPTYWSANTHPDLPTAARVVSFMPGIVLANGDKTGNGYAWCVRGGSGLEAQ